MMSSLKDKHYTQMRYCYYLILTFQSHWELDENSALNNIQWVNDYWLKWNEKKSSAENSA